MTTIRIQKPSIRVLTPPAIDTSELVIWIFEADTFQRLDRLCKRNVGGDVWEASEDVDLSHAATSIEVLIFQRQSVQAMLLLASGRVEKSRLLSLAEEPEKRFEINIKTIPSVYAAPDPWLALVANFVEVVYPPKDGSSRPVQAFLGAPEMWMKLFGPDGHPIPSSANEERAGAPRMDEEEFNNRVLQTIQDIRPGVQTGAAESFHALGTVAFQSYLATGDAQHLNQALSCYSHSIAGLSKRSWLRSTARNRHGTMGHVGSTVRNAAAAAIRAGRYETAIEWLEQGRSVIWSQILQLRSSVDDLRIHYPELANRLNEISQLLDDRDIDAEGILSDLEEINPAHQPFRELVHEKERLLRAIRSIQGYERFLLPKTVKELLPAAKKGPVILLNVNWVGCDALILKPRCDQVQRLSLQITPEKVESWRTVITGTLKRTGRTIECDRHGRPISSHGPQLAIEPEQTLSAVLESLWWFVAVPVLDAVGYTTPISPEEPRRIWWCPTGPLTSMPIHAAGAYLTYPDSGMKLANFAISSYIPSISSLIGASRQPKQNLGPHVLLVGQSSSEGAPTLPNTSEEIKRISTRTGRYLHAALLDDEATAEAVQDALKLCNWVHFACHGIQETSNPSESSLLLAGKSRLALSEIIKMSNPDGAFGFLSACQTATGTEPLADESVHLAAGMLLAGYKSVIATMWSIEDRIAPEIADEVYCRLFDGNHHRNGLSTPDHRRAAEALHYAIEKVKQRRVPLLSWVPFVHIGI